MTTELRLDTALVRRGFARSRTQAARLIAEDRVTIAGEKARKAGRRVGGAVALAVAPGDDFASRGARKLRGALDEFAIDVTGRRALDAGASTGGFTDLLLHSGAAAVAAVDVGTGQLDPRLAADDRVFVHDATNVRELTAGQAALISDQLGGPPELIVADISFISLTLVLPQLAALAAPGADLLPMVKPQFEVGKERLGRGGVVRGPALRAEAVMRVAACARSLGWRTVGAVASPLPGPSGNVEYFLHLRHDEDAVSGPMVGAVSEHVGDTPHDDVGDPPRDDVGRVARWIHEAVARGPQ